MPALSARSLLLNLGHALDHFFLLIYTTAVIALAPEFGLTYGEMLPYATGAFVAFGLGSLPAGWLGDKWSRHAMMIVFFIGIGLSSIGAGLARTPLELGVALTTIGLFAAIYHPVGIAMLVQDAKAVGFTLGVNGVAGNLGVALAAVVTGFLIDHFGWRMAFHAPGALSIALGLLFWGLVPREAMAPAKCPAKTVAMPRALVVRVFVVLTITATCGSAIFNATTIAMPKLFSERLPAIAATGTEVGTWVAVVFTIAAMAQLLAGRLIDTYPLKMIFLPVAALQAPIFWLVATAQDVPLLIIATAGMFLVFGQIPFGDSLIARYFDDRWRSRVYAVRLTVGLTASSATVPLVGYLHDRAGGFDLLLHLVAAVALVTVCAVAFLPGERAAEPVAA